MAALLAMPACAQTDEPMVRPATLPGQSPVRYPVGLWDAEVNGETMLMVRVTEHGDVDSAYVLQSSGHADFDTAAVRGARQLRFSPGLRGQRPVPMWTRLPIRFQRDSIGAVEPEPVAPDSSAVQAS
jgi:TonB family protein